MGIVLLKASGMLLPRRVESTITQLPSSPNVSRIPTALRLPCSKLCSYPPTRFSYGTQYLEIQPPDTKAPLSPMPIRTLEVRAARFLLGWDVPATTTLVCNERQAEATSDILDENSIVVN